MLKNNIEKSVLLEMRKKQAEAKKNGENLPLNYSNELEILVYSKNKLIKQFKNK